MDNNYYFPDGSIVNRAEFADEARIVWLNVKEERALCPFGCVGGELGLYQLPDSNSRHVFCKTCGASGPWGETNEEAERLWNERKSITLRYG